VKQTLQTIGLSMIVVGLALAMVWLIIFGSRLPTTRVYDCGMAEWHPDIPLEVREECRKLRSKNNVTV